MAGSTSVPLVAAVSNAGGLGTLGIARTPDAQIPTDIAAIRHATTGPFGVNFLLFRAHDAGSRVMYMAGTVPEALRARAAGADVIVAQGTEGGGHVGWMASMAVL